MERDENGINSPRDRLIFEPFEINSCLRQSFKKPAQNVSLLRSKKPHFWYIPISQLSRLDFIWPIYILNSIYIFDKHPQTLDKSFHPTFPTLAPLQLFQFFLHLTRILLSWFTVRRLKFRFLECSVWIMSGFCQKLFRKFSVSRVCIDFLLLLISPYNSE